MKLIISISLFLLCTGFLIACSSPPKNPDVRIVVQPQKTPPPPQITATAQPTISTPTPPPVPSNTPEPTAIPATPTPLPSPTKPIPTVVRSTIECTIIDDTYSYCTDHLLNIEFELPTNVGVITSTLVDRNVDPIIAPYWPGFVGHTYYYTFENYPHATNFENLDTVGWGDDFSYASDAGILSTKFTGCSGATICEEISPNLLIKLHFPNAHQLCEPSPGMTYVAYGVVVLHLPENPHINVFYFTAPTISQEVNDELVEILFNWETHERNCSEETKEQFNLKLEEIVTQIEQETLDETSLHNIRMLYHIANSIQFLEQPQ